ncbi:hypothetical protein GEMRC1_013561 [Eukaryota sp. GEM-RC1]
MTDLDHLSFLATKIPSKEQQQKAAQEYESFVKTKRQKDKIARKERSLRRFHLTQSQKQNQTTLDNTSKDDVISSQVIKETPSERPLSTKILSIRNAEGPLTTKALSFADSLAKAEAKKMLLLDEIGQLEVDEKKELAQRRVETQLLRYEENKERRRMKSNKEAVNVVSDWVSDLINEVSSAAELHTISRADCDPNELKNVDEFLINHLVNHFDYIDDETIQSLDSFPLLLSYLRSIAYPPPPPPEPLHLPSFPLKMMITGPPCSGRTSICTLLGERFDLIRISLKEIISLCDSDPMTWDSWMSEFSEDIPKIKEISSILNIAEDLKTVLVTMMMKYLKHLKENTEDSRGFLLDSSF